MSAARLAWAVVADGGVVVAVGRTQPGDELVFGVVDRERAAQPGGGDRAGFGDTKSGEMAGDPVGVGVQAFSEQGFHLVFADR